MANEKEEIFSSVKAANQAANDGFLKAIGTAVLVGVITSIIIAAMGIKGGIVGIVPAILSLITFRALRNEAKKKNL